MVASEAILLLRKEWRWEGVGEMLKNNFRYICGSISILKLTVMKRVNSVLLAGVLSFAVFMAGS